ncbi:hypothetical protein Aduo_016082 [Ancylostoma duodenale]
MKYILLACVTIAIVCCEPPVYIEELEALVQKKGDKSRLRNLIEDEYMIRSEKQIRLNAILSLQSKEIQIEYKATVKAEKLKKRRQLVGQQARAAKYGYSSLLSKILAIDSDMSISDSEASKREDALVEVLTSSSVCALIIFDGTT